MITVFKMFRLVDSSGCQVSKPTGKWLFHNNKLFGKKPLLRKSHKMQHLNITMHYIHDPYHCVLCSDEIKIKHFGHTISMACLSKKRGLRTRKCVDSQCQICWRIIDDLELFCGWWFRGACEEWKRWLFLPGGSHLSMDRVLMSQTYFKLTQKCFAMTI